MPRVQDISTAVWKFCNLGAKADDPDQLRLSKAILVLTSLIIAFLAIFWGTLYIFLGYPLSGAIPLSYAVISFFSMIFFFVTRRFSFFRFSQFLLVFLLPFLLMWSLGGFANGSVVMVWAFFAPLAALLFADKRQMTFWVVAFVVFTVISGLIDPYVRGLAPPMAPAYNTAFFVMNMGAGFVAFYFILMMFVNDRAAAHERLTLANRRLQENEARIRELMLTDALTGVPNRRHLEDKMKKEFNRVSRSEKYLSLVVADIDNFKTINDDFGHDAGDEVIKAFARTLQDTVRDYDFVARIGGEEFVLLLPGSDPVATGRVVDRCREQFATLVFPNIDRTITASFGIALCEKGETGHDCLKRADGALYLSKQHGRNRVTFG
ncbi:MAG: GGDEF domain-containing protein [Gammaproteobacteria bacterium]